MCKILQSLNHLCGPLLDTLQYSCVVLGHVDLYPALQMCLTSAELRRITSLSLFAVHCPVQSRMLLASFAIRTHCWSWHPPGPQGPSLSVSSSASQSLVCTGACIYFSPGVGGFSISLCWTCKIPVGPFLQSVKIPLEKQHNYGYSSHSSQFCIIWKYAKGALSSLHHSGY